MILSAQELDKLRPVSPWSSVKRIFHGMSYGLGPAGYDIRCAQDIELRPGDFKLASSIEHFTMPNDLLAQVCDKSSWARNGLFVQNTIIEPGWLGFLTIELTYHGAYPIKVSFGSPIAQIIFHRLSTPTDRPYAGKYQNQPSTPTPAIHEGA